MARGVAFGLALLGLLCVAHARDFTVVRDVFAEKPSDVNFLVLGEPQQEFNRPAPRTIDPRVVEDFHKQLSFMQDMSADVEDPNTFTAVSTPYVASIPDAFVEGDSGLVWDKQGHVYHERGMFYERTTPNPIPTQITEEAVFNAATKEHYPMLATTIQKYGHMYYHFVVETLPKLVLLKRAGLPAGTKVLVWGEPHEYKFLERLGFAKDDLVVYDPLKVYSADVLFFPTPVARITPARESLEMVREELGVRVLPEEERDLVVYCSREGAGTREVANEAELLGAIQAAYPGQEVVVYNNIDDVDELVSLFERAKVVIGPHGAGLSHMLFAAPGTKVVEFQFMRDPPMMFWHVAAALREEYWMVPVPNSWWMQKEMTVPVEEVMDILDLFFAPQADLANACSPGSFLDNEGECQVCPEGQYSFNFGQEACKPCFSGRYAARAGSSSCRTCPPDTFAEEGQRCVKCPAGKINWVAGASSESSCVTFDDHKDMLRDISLNLQMLRKLSPRMKILSKRTLSEITTYGEPVPAPVATPQAEAMSGPAQPAAQPATQPAAAAPSSQMEELIQACRLRGAYDDPYMMPPSLADLDCSALEQVGAMDKAGEDKPHEVGHFKEDAECLTGFAIKNTHDLQRDQDGSKSFCVRCDLPMLLDVTKCDIVDASEDCCKAVKFWNNGGCMCAHSSQELANEMGASHSFVKALSSKCGFSVIAEEDNNCPAKPAEGHLRAAGESSAAFAPATLLASAFVGAATLLIFAIFT